MGSGVLRVTRGGSRAKTPPFAARPGKSDLKISLFEPFRVQIVFHGGGDEGTGTPF